MNTSSYLIAWAFYAVNAIGLTYWLCRLLQNKWPQLTFKSFAPILILLLSPYFSAPGQSYLAPAMLVVVFEAAFGDMSLAIKALTLPVILVSILYGTALLRHMKVSRKTTG